MSARLTFGLGMTVAVLLLITWHQGWFILLAVLATDVQRDVQNAIAGTIRQIKAGDPAAMAMLILLCFGYGVVHAIGPGHGKIVLGAYALSNRVSARRLITVSIVASLAQAASAIAMVYAGVFVFSWSRDQMTGIAEQFLTTASYLMIGGIGIYISWRSLRMLFASARDGARRPRDTDHHAGCSHSHAPTLEDVARIASWRDSVFLVAGVAIRPCSGALLVLLLCWRIGNNMAGILGALAMGLGTAIITIVAALVSLSMREGALSIGSSKHDLRLLSGGLGLLAGIILVGTSAMLVQPALN